VDKYQLLAIGVLVGWAFPLEYLWGIAYGLVKNKFKFVNEDWKIVSKQIIAENKAKAKRRDLVKQKSNDPVVKKAVIAAKKANKKKTAKKATKKVAKAAKKAAKKKTGKTLPTTPNILKDL